MIIYDIKHLKLFKHLKHLKLFKHLKHLKHPKHLIKIMNSLVNDY